MSCFTFSPREIDDMIKILLICLVSLFYNKLQAYGIITSICIYPFTSLYDPSLHLKQSTDIHES